LKEGDLSKILQDVRRWLLGDFLTRKITSIIPNLKIKKEETIMRKNKMNIAILSCIGIFLITALMIVPAAQAGGKTVKYKIVAPITKWEFVPIPDVKGHVVGVLERRGVAIYENGEIGAFHTSILLDSFKEQKTFSGYCSESFADGSMTIWKSQGTASGSMPILIKGTGQYIKGTGRFEGIKGEIFFNGKMVTPYTKDATKGDAVFDFTSTYTLPKK
jgi:hypothetical protein